MTTQNERLRELLGSASGYVGHSPGCAPKYCHQCRLSNQIDAALAEPVENSDARIKELETLLAFQKDMNTSDLRLLRSFEAALDSTQVVIDRMNKERDEARAEVERLKIALDSIRAARSLLGQLRDHVSDQACEELMCILADEPLDADGNLYVTPTQDAYRRGAEAMREAAADLFQGNKPGLAAIPHWSAFIRALPIPEDKP